MTTDHFDLSGPLPAPGVTVLEASAGTGKTYSIAGLFARFVAEQDVRADRILVVTFGKAATSELRDRVRARLREQRDAAASDGNAVCRERLTAALESFGDAAVSTIHGFCARVLRDHALASDAEMDAELLGEPSELLSEIARDYWDAHVATEKTDVTRALVAPGKRKPKLTLDDLLDVAKKATRDPRAPIEPALQEGDDEKSLVAIKRACALRARKELEARLRAARQMTYDDLLRRVQQALLDPARGPVLCNALRAAYDVVLVDEFQDTDGVQWDIFRTAFGTPTHRLILVGDPKQSIYGFRGADVQAYLRAVGEGVFRQSLVTNHRSDAPYVDALNHLFASSARPFGVEAIRYEPVRAKYGARLAGNDSAPFVVRFFARGEHLPPSTNPKNGPPTKGRVEKWIPSLVAADVVRFLHSGATIDGRPVRPSDVAVLVRKNAQAAEVRDALRDAGVPSVLQTIDSVFTTPVAVELETVLRAVLEPSSARQVRAALATDLLGLVAAAELREAGESLGVGDALVRLDADDAALDRWHERFRAWSEKWERGGTAVLVRAIVGELSLPERHLAFDDGERRFTNLLHIAELLHAEETERRLDPGRVALWLRRQIEDPLPEEPTRRLRLETDASAARVATIHASKGLEYPVVWCPYLWDGALAVPRDKKHAYYRTDDGGRALHLSPPAKGEECARLDDECFEENLRLLYVALTRAKHRCTVWWGEVAENHSSPLGWLLHGGAEGSLREARRACERAMKGLDAEAIRARAIAVARSSGGLIRVFDEKFDAPERWRGEQDTAPPLAARPYARRGRLDGDRWRYGSFTGLTHRRGAHATALADVPEAAEDARDDVTGDTAPEKSTGTVSLAEFPASASAGVFFHDVLERHDFANDDALPALVADRLGAFGFDAPRWATSVADSLRGVLGASIRAGDHALRLRDVPRERRVAEMRFELPVCGGLAIGAGAVTPKTLAAAFRENPGGTLAGDVLVGYADRVAQLGFDPLRGFLTGAIDLLLEHEGRWWIVDWKSNRLGATHDDYAPDRLLDEMTEAHYVLQYHLYLVAMHRWLGARVPGYDYDTHVGGACYPFLRGVADDATTGVFVDRPPRSRIEALDLLLREGA